jgi:hypothetical protein
VEEDGDRIVPYKRRKQFVLDRDGDGDTVECALRCVPGCLGTLTYETVTVDRIVPGVRGGQYTSNNVQAACAPCNSSAEACALKGVPVTKKTRVPAPAPVPLTKQIDEGQLREVWKRTKCPPHCASCGVFCERRWLGPGSNLYDPKRAG